MLQIGRPVSPDDDSGIVYSESVRYYCSGDSYCSEGTLMINKAPLWVSYSLIIPCHFVSGY